MPVELGTAAPGEVVHRKAVAGRQVEEELHIAADQRMAPPPKPKDLAAPFLDTPVVVVASPERTVAKSGRPMVAALETAGRDMIVPRHKQRDHHIHFAAAEEEQQLRRRQNSPSAVVVREEV